MSGGVPVSGTKTGITTTPVALAPTQFCKSIGLQADPANATDLLIGDETSQTMQLAAGASLSIEVRDPSLIWVKSVSGTVICNFILVV